MVLLNLGDYMNIIFIGGDHRMKIALNELKNQGYTVDSLGLFSEDSGNISDADVIILPVPTTRDNTTINCCDSGKTIPLSIVQSANKNALILGCGYNFECANYIDYSKLDSFCIANAVPTAEGAIARAIDDTPFCLWNSKVLVICCTHMRMVLMTVP